MDAQCPKCFKEYDLNEAHLAKGSIKVKCPKCNHVWAIKKQGFKPENRPSPLEEKVSKPVGRNDNGLSRLPKLLPTEDLTRLRVLVGFLGERSQDGWWDTNFLSKTGIQYLEICFPRTALAAGCVSVSEAAKKLHDDRIGKGGVFHLFRLPSAFEERVHRHLLKVQPGEVLAAIETRETAISKLEEFAESTGGTSEGPIRLGDSDEILTGGAISAMAAQYLDAFSKGLMTFPYFTERRI
jgi:predicted Zn finger-like uncharacterized protein